MSLIQRSALRRLPKPTVTIAHPTRRTFVGTTWGALVNTVADGICAVHHVGLPWYMTIPLVAATVNFTIRLPVQYYARQTRHKYAQDMPVVQAWERLLVRKAMKKIDPSSPDAQSQPKSALTLPRGSALATLAGWLSLTITITFVANEERELLFSQQQRQDYLSS